MPQGTELIITIEDENGNQVQTETTVVANGEANTEGLSNGDKQFKGKCKIGVSMPCLRVQKRCNELEKAMGKDGCWLTGDIVKEDDEKYIDAIFTHDFK